MLYEDLKREILENIMIEPFLVEKLKKVFDRFESENKNKINCTGLEDIDFNELGHDEYLRRITLYRSIIYLEKSISDLQMKSLMEPKLQDYYRGEMDIVSSLLYKIKKQGVKENGK